MPPPPSDFVSRRSPSRFSGNRQSASRKIAGSVFCAALAFILIFTTLASGQRDAQETKLRLHRNWEIQSSCRVKADGKEISAAAFPTRGWHHAEVPTTVVAALVADQTYPDPYFGRNLKSFPGMDYSSAEFFANQTIPGDSPFHCSWWFRTEFQAPASSRRKTTWLHFDGINYRANVWLNGEKIAGAQDTAGTFRAFEFNVRKQLHAGKTNALAVEVSAPDKGDLGITWVDWNPTPADKDMGLWKDVYLTTSGPVSLRAPLVTSKLDADYKAASLTINADLRNISQHPVRAQLRAELDGIQVVQPVELGPDETKTVTLSPDQYPELKLEHPRLWWPYQMGQPELYSVKLTVRTDGQVSDTAAVRVGVREVTSQLTDKGHRLFTINGRKILIRGAAWAPDMLLRWSPAQAAAALEYVRDMHLNAIRMEGRMERDEFFDMADRLGILIMPGWTCCDAWEKWDQWTSRRPSPVLPFRTRSPACAIIPVFLYGSTAATILRRQT